MLHSGKGWIAALQEKEREQTGDQVLKIGYNRIFGYDIDVTKPNLHLVPPHYERRQTTATGERYTLPALKEKEAVITNADERVFALERELYTALIARLRKIIPDLQATAHGIAVLDASASLAEVAKTRDDVRPQMNDGDTITIRDGRHPCGGAGRSGGFVPNDTDLSGSKTQIMIITGANMAGKSTYMRATALTCIMAQAGSFVPARHAAIGIIDRIFTRVGAFDDLASGQTTFFVEMLELANILNNVTQKSLVILDEIGRGTSTADGSSIARAVLEFLHGKKRPGQRRSLPRTSTRWSPWKNTLKRVKNYHFAVRETNNEVIFLRNSSRRDRQELRYPRRPARRYPEESDRTGRSSSREHEPGRTRRTRPSAIPRSCSWMTTGRKTRPRNPVREELAKIKPDEMTPLQALAKIAELQRSLENSGGTP